MKILACLMVCISVCAFGKTLTRTEAMGRSAALEKVSYSFTINLDAEKTDFTGTQDIKFNLLNNKDDLRVDFKEGAITNLYVNGLEVKDYKKDDQAIYLPTAKLKIGENEVIIDFSHAFSHEGTGLHRFVDPEDKKVYLYTHFEPNDASRFIPCFDQPDIKAPYSMEVTAPADWTVISTKRETQVTPVSDKLKKWVFPQSWNMSTYLYSLHAGPYAVWKSQAGKIPLRVFARHSLSKYMDEKNWFTYTKQGLSFYGKYFATPYPFEKYDEIVVPEFNAGAMENIAAITFSERFISRGQKTSLEKQHLASVILHEMAHMWFGDLVTMKWWNDLWLNESFATYMAAKAMAEATEFKSSWMDFFLGDKAWAYYSDQLPTTHPISTTIDSADEAFNNFDGITYGKGASVMKQLAYLIGEKDFQKGLQNYFAKYAYKNADLKDFLAALAEKSDQDISQWAAQWLETKGLDTLAADFTCKDGKFESLHLKVQTATPSVLRTHAFETVFMKFKNGKLQPVHTAAMKIKDTLSYTHQGITCPDVVYPNYNDYGYFKLQLDGKTVESLKSKLTKTDNAFLRAMFWDSLWQMTRDQQMALQDYLEVFKKNVGSENSYDILNTVLRTVSGGDYFTKNSAYHFYPTERRHQLFKRQELVHEVEDMYLSKAEEAAPGSDFQQLWMDNFIQATETVRAQTELTNWLKGKLILKGLAPQPDRRWKAILKLCNLGNTEAMDLMEKEKAEDKSDRAKVNSYSCQASRPDLDVKKQWWAKIVDQHSGLSFGEKRGIMRTFYNDEQRTFLSKEFANDYFKILGSKNQNYSEGFLKTFTTNMGPDNCTKASNTLMKGFLSKNQDVSPVIIRDLTEMVADDERCVKIKALASTKE